MHASSLYEFRKPFVNRRQSEYAFLLYKNVTKTLTHPLSFNTKIKMPAPISISKSITRNNEYWNIEKNYFKTGNYWQTFLDFKNSQNLTAASKHVFSRSAPTQPVKPMINVIVPLQIKINAGSNAIVVILEILLNTSFSVQAQNPTAIIHSPSS